MTPPFDPNRPYRVASKFDPNKPYRIVEDDHNEVDRDLMPYLKGAAKGVMSAGAHAIGGAAKLALHPERAVEAIGSLADNPMEDIPDAIKSTASGLYRAVRKTPLVGDVVQSLGKHGSHLVDLATKSEEEAGKNYHDYDANLAKEDAEHADNHPINDFIQHSIGMFAMPAQTLSQIGILAADTYSHSIKQGNKPWDALKDARNVAVLSAMTLGGAHGAAKLPSLANKKLHKYMQQETKLSPKDVDRYREAPETVREAAKAHPLDEAKAIISDIDSRGLQLKELSDKALDIAVLEGVDFSIKGLIQRVNNSMRELTSSGIQGPSGSARRVAYQALEGIKQTLLEHKTRLNLKGSTRLSAKDMKDIIKDIDSMSYKGYTTPTGQLVKLSDKEMMGIRSNFNQAMRKASKGYAKVMDELSPKVKNVENISEFFGDEAKALNSLKSFDRNNPRSMLTDQAMKNYDSEFGTSHTRRAEDASIGRQFNKDTTTGARKAAGFGAAGAAVGGYLFGEIGALVGAGVGARVGMALDKNIGLVYQTMLDSGLKFDKLIGTPYLKEVVQAASEAPKSLALLHYSLSQKDPEYQKLMQ